MGRNVETSSIYDEEFSVLRPKMGRGRAPSSKSGAQSFRNALLGRSGGNFRQLFVDSPRGSEWGNGPFGRNAPANARRVVVQSHFVRMTPKGAKLAASHLRYILRDGVEKDGSPGVLYGPDGPVSPKSFTEPRPKETLQFRWVVSPEDAGDLDMTKYIRQYMKRIERETCMKLEWAAVNHYNTEHPHTHVVVRGVDLDGRRVRFSRTYTSFGLRRVGQELATDTLGPRPTRSIERAREREVTQERLTSLDREIGRAVVGNDIRASSQKTSPDAGLIVGRLRHLEKLGLAAPITATSWKMTDGWQASLRELGARGDILKQLYKSVGDRATQYHIVRPGAPLEPDTNGRSTVVVGRVVSKGLADELKGTMYAVIETPRGKGYHVQLDANTAAKFRVGDVVSFGMRTGPSPRVWARKATLSIQEQIVHRGVTWLDQLSPKLLSSRGLGVELGKAIHQRDEFLKTLGIVRGAPGRMASIRALAQRPKLEKGRGGLER